MGQVQYISDENNNITAVIVPIDLFLQLCLQNNGCLSAGKRESHFGFLTDDELADMENAVREGYAADSAGSA